jgi:hypothetical protein
MRFDDYFEGFLSFRDELKTFSGLFERESMGDHLPYRDTTCPDELYGNCCIQGAIAV